MTSISRVYTSDFETTGETNFKKYGIVRVWLWSLISLDGCEEYYGTDIESWLNKIFELNCKKIWFHNLAFDGTFIIDYLARAGYTYGVDYSAIVSTLNVYYQIKIGKITLQDSLKKFPQTSVDGVADLLGIPGKKEKPFFDALRAPDYIPNKEEIEYCLQDSRVMAVAMKKMYEDGLSKMTLTSDTFSMIMDSFGGVKKFKKHFPKVPYETDVWIRDSYRGGITYLKPDKTGIDLEDVFVYDVNSLYTYIMVTRQLPYGKPVEREPEKDELFIIEIEAEFTLKKDHLPTLEAKNDFRYGNHTYITKTISPMRLVLTSVDYKLFHDHYDIDYEIVKRTVVYPHSEIGVINDFLLTVYEDKQKVSKIMKDPSYSDKERAHAKYERFLDKRKMNGFYGRMAIRQMRENKIPYIGDDENLHWTLDTSLSDGQYLPYGVFVTAWARDYLVRNAQNNYKNFIYADTDSIHTIGPAVGLDVDHLRLGAWDKEEEHVPHAKYLKSKTYLHADKDHVPYQIKCAGLNSDSRGGVTWDNFVVGTTFYDGLKRVTVKGGCYLKTAQHTIT